MSKRRADYVVGVDVSPEMIRIARERSADFPNIEYVIVDVATWDFPVDRFDCVVSFASLHHVPLERVLHKMQPCSGQAACCW